MTVTEYVVSAASDENDRAILEPDPSIGRLRLRRIIVAPVQEESEALAQMCVTSIHVGDQPIILGRVPAEAFTESDWQDWNLSGIVWGAGVPIVVQFEGRHKMIVSVVSRRT